MDLKESMRCQEDVALSITKHLFSKEDYQQKNLIFSPLSLHAVLSVMAAGSDGNTLNELLSFLRFDSIDHLTTFFSQVISPVLFSNDAADASSNHLCFANGMWIDDSLSLSHSFKQLVATHYNATLASVDFKTKGDQVHHEVNSWVEKETNGLITQLLPPRTVSNLTRLIFANALPFKGEWKHKFEAKPIKYNFYLLNGTSVKIASMGSKKKEHLISVFDGFKVLGLPYKQGRDKMHGFTMYIFLPDAKDGLFSIIEKLASESSFLNDKFPQQEVRVRRFVIPKFKISFTIEASDVLKEMGVVSPFSQRDAGFTKMVEEVNSPLDKLYVESMIHKAFIEVNDEKTEASASTLIRARAMRGGTSAALTGIDFVADHPFLFLIREDFSGTILFVGQVLDPLDGTTN
ncbi:serpin-ZX-like [Lotus japonicus]|uniref:serpin-ZX-like n=1 Tax=Lotus japonicus TaxID=34305 RepID=UPI0025845D9F|nr:serpin-ZX-like [Lotus japonicus]